MRELRADGKVGKHRPTTEGPDMHTTTVNTKNVRTIRTDRSGNGRAVNLTYWRAECVCGWADKWIALEWLAAKRADEHVTDSMEAAEFAAPATNEVRPVPPQILKHFGL